jgi:hypothetical protein
MLRHVQWHYIAPKFPSGGIHYVPLYPLVHNHLITKFWLVIVIHNDIFKCPTLHDLYTQTRPMHIPINILLNIVFKIPVLKQIPIPDSDVITLPWFNNANDKIITYQMLAHSFVSASHVYSCSACPSSPVALQHTVLCPSVSYGP